MEDTLLRSSQMVPGNSPAMILNSPVFGADLIILDLEDAIAPSQKDAARILVRNALAEVDFGQSALAVRVNDISTPWWEEDIKEALKGDIDFLLIPKVENVADFLKIEEFVSGVEKDYGKQTPVNFIALIESCLAIENSFQLASCSPRLKALQLGAEDYTADLGAVRTKKGDEIAYARGRLLNAGRAAGVAVLDTPFTDVDDMDGLEVDVQLSRDLGFDGKASISPRHIDTINRIYMPTEDEIEYAELVVKTSDDAERRGLGVVSLDGKMIDAPIVNRARAVLRKAQVGNRGIF